MKYIIPFILISLLFAFSSCSETSKQKKNDKNLDSKTNIDFKIVEKETSFVLKEFNPSELSPYFENMKWGYIDKKGEIVIKSVFDACSFPVENYAWVRTDGKYKIINSKGEFIQDSTSYDGVGNVFRSMIPVKKGNLWGVIDTTGNLLISFAYESFSFPDDGFIHVQQNQQWGIITYTGEQICAPIYDVDFHFEGNCAIVSRGYKKKGVINKSGKETVKCNYSQVTIVSDSIFILQKEPNYNTKKYGVIANEQVLYPVEYDRIEPLFDTMLVLTKENSSGIVCFRGDTILDFVYSDLKVGNTNIIAAKKDSKWGFISLFNDTIIDFKYDEVEAFRGNVAIVGFGQEKYSSYNSTYSSGLINHKGEFVIPIAKQTLKFLSDNVIMAVLDYSKYKLYTIDGEQISSTYFDNNQYHSAEDYTGEVDNPMNLYEFVNGFAIIGHKGRVGMINSKGEIVVPMKYHHLEPMNEYGYTKAMFLNKYGIIDCKGNEIVPIGYDNIGYDYSCNHYYLQYEVKGGESKYRRDYINVGYFNYNGKYLGKSAIGKPLPFVLEENIKKIRNSYNRIQKETKNAKVIERELLGNGVVGRYTNNKLVVTDKNNGVTYEYFYDESLNRNGPFFIFEVRDNTENRYYYLHGRIIRWLDENKNEQLIADALFAPENEQHYLARRYKTDFDNAELLKKYKVEKIKSTIDGLCAKISEDIGNGMYKRGDSDNTSMGEYQVRQETYLDDEQNLIYSLNSQSDEGGGYTEESYYMNGELIRSSSNHSYIDNTNKEDEPFWTSGQYETIVYHDESGLVIIEENKGGITKILINE